MRGNRYHPLPERCCMKCKYSKPISSGKLKCCYEDSFYFECIMARSNHCPDFLPDKKTDH